MKPTRTHLRGQKWVVYDAWGPAQHVTYRKHERALRKREARSEVDAR